MSCVAFTFPFCQSINSFHKQANTAYAWFCTLLGFFFFLCFALGLHKLPWWINSQHSQTALKCNYLAKCDRHKPWNWWLWSFCRNKLFFFFLKKLGTKDSHSTLRHNSCKAVSSLSCIPLGLADFRKVLLIFFFNAWLCSHFPYLSCVGQRLPTCEHCISFQILPHLNWRESCLN